MSIVSKNVSSNTNFVQKTHRKRSRFSSEATDSRKSSRFCDRFDAAEIHRKRSRFSSEATDSWTSSRFFPDRYVQKAGEEKESSLFKKADRRDRSTKNRERHVTSTRRISSYNESNIKHPKLKEKGLENTLRLAPSSIKKSNFDYKDSMRIIENLEKKSIPLDTATCNAAISACRREGKLETTLYLLKKMEKEGICKNTITYNAAISVCERDGNSKTALNFLECMKKEGIDRDTITYNSLISTCKKEGDSKTVLYLLKGMEKEGIPKNTITYNSAISTCEKEGNWKEAVNLLKRMEKEGIDKDAITYSTAISACLTAGQQEAALKLLRKAVDEKIFKSKLGIKIEDEKATINYHIDSIFVSAKKKDLFSGIHLNLAKTIFIHHLGKLSKIERIILIVGQHGKDILKNGMYEFIKSQYPEILIKRNFINLGELNLQLSVP